MVCPKNVWIRHCYFLFFLFFDIHFIYLQTVSIFSSPIVNETMRLQKLCLQLLPDGGLITVCATFYFCIFTDSDKELLCLLLLAVSWDREHYQRKIGIYFDIHILFIYCIQKEYCLYSKLHPKVQKFFSILKKYFCPQRAKSLHIYCEVSFKC